MRTTLKEIKEDFYVFSGKASTISRQLGLAGIAIIWLFKTENHSQIQLGNELISILRLLVISLLLDFCHAFVPSIIYGIMNSRFRNNGKKDEDEIQYSQGWTIPEWLFFVAKIGILVLAYIKLLNFLSQKII